MEPKAIKQERDGETPAEETSSNDIPTSAGDRRKGVRVENTCQSAPDASSLPPQDSPANDASSRIAAPPVKQSYCSSRSFSPHSTVNGTPTSSPPALTSPLQPSSSHDVTQNGNGRQLTKVRRFLTTLQQFASDIGSDVGERVRSLILNLLSGTISVEEFHCALQEVTHFPLRPFVLPFLRSHLPLLSRELHSLARRAAMTISQYIAVQESNLMDATAGEPTDFFSSEVTSGKRKLDSYLENGDSSSSGTSTSSVNGAGISAVNGGHLSPPPSKRATIFSPPFPPLGLSPDHRTVGHDDEWKNIHVMLTCILSMVEKTRRALTMLQQREDPPPPAASGGRCPSNELRSRPDYDAEVRRHASELVAHAIRSTEDRVAEVKRKAEEAVMEVRKAAVAEVQRAVASAESKAQELVNAERSRMEGLLREVALRESSVGEHKVEPQQACWNCGRKAQDTCSGCNVAKYCSAYCQHKDWDHHHKVCSPSLLTAPSATSLVVAKSVGCKLHKTVADPTKTE